MENIVGFLGETLTRIVAIVKQVLTNLANGLKSILTNIQTTIRQPIIDALNAIKDTLVSPAITTLQTAYENILTRVQTAIEELKTSAKTQFDAYIQYLTDLSADGVNAVTKLAADLQSLLENSAAVNAAQCAITYGPAIQDYATNFIPTFAECVEEASVNATSLIDTALDVAGLTLGQAEDLIQEFRACIAPTLADPRNFMKKILTVACLGDLSDTSIVDGTVLVNTVNSAASEFVNALTLAASDALRCVTYKNTEAVLGALFIENSIKECLLA